MQKFLSLLAALVAAAGTSFAQAPASSQAALPTAVQSITEQPTTPMQPADRRAQYLAKELGLSADQQARLQPILQAQRQEMLGLRDKLSAGGSRQELGQQLKAAQANYNAQIRAVLTPEQYSKFDQLNDERREKLRERQ